VRALTNATETPRRSQHVPEKRRPQPRRQQIRSSQSPDRDDDEPQSYQPPTTQTPSSARPPPPASILKKLRGPSASGPRPTARFVSPQESENEAAKDVPEVSSGSTATSGIEMRPPSAKAEKKPTASMAKKFVASSTTKRRPAMPRRPSSQSSATGSEISPSAGSRSSASRSLNVVAEAAARKATPKSQGSSDSSSVREQPRLSVKAAGKRPAGKPAEKRGATARSGSLQANQDRPVIVQGDAPTAQGTVQGNARPDVETRESYRARNPPRRGLSQTESLRSGALEAPKMTRSQSQTDQPRPRDLNDGRAPLHGLVAPSIAEMSSVAAQGKTFDAEKPDIAATPYGSSFGISEQSTPAGLVSRPSATSLLESRFTPTAPSPAPKVPFGRSKSQLTLLLEREKSRLGEPPKPKVTPRRDDIDSAKTQPRTKN